MKEIQEDRNSRRGRALSANQMYRDDCYYIQQEKKVEIALKGRRRRQPFMLLQNLFIVGFDFIVLMAMTTRTGREQVEPHLWAVVIVVRARRLDFFVHISS